MAGLSQPGSDGSNGRLKGESGRGMNGSGNESKTARSAKLRTWGRKGGRKGGRAKGERKARGGSEYYQELGRKSGVARARKAAIRREMGL